MYVSVTPFNVQPDKIDEFLSYALDVVVPAIRAAGVGYKGGYILRSDTEILSVNFYETEAQVTALPTDEKALAILKKLASLGEADFGKRKVYEVAVNAPLTDT